MVKRMPPLHDAPQFEDRELAVVHHLRPTHPAVEVWKSPKVAGAESDQVRKRKRAGHAFTTRRRADNESICKGRIRLADDGHDV